MPNRISENIGQKIKKLCLIKGYKQEYMAYEIGLTQTGYSKIETGETNITVKRASIIAGIFGMSLVELIEWEEFKT